MMLVLKNTLAIILFAHTTPVECKSISTSVSVSVSEIRLTQGVIRYDGVSQLYVG